MDICGFRHHIMVEDASDGTFRVTIESDCPNVQMYDEMLGYVESEELTRLNDTRVIRLADAAGLTPTCLVPMAVLNACWVEAGLMSKNLACKSEPLRIIFHRGS